MTVVNAVHESANPRRPTHLLPDAPGEPWDGELLDGAAIAFGPEGAAIGREARTRPARRKRAIDVLMAAPMLLVAAPIVLLAALAILMLDRHRPFFIDQRVGKGGTLFRCLKLRTMRSDPALLVRYFDANPEELDRYQRTRKLSRDPRITPLGRFLRNSSMDELPQLWNVLRGEMSIVGPRPLGPAEFVERGIDAEPLKLVRPGLTGLWQVSGRSNTSLARRVALDNQYATSWSLALDLRIVLATPVAVLLARGAR